MQVVEFVDAEGRSPFAHWFDHLNAQAARKVTVALTRIGLGNLAVSKSVGGGVLECTIDFGPGYRVYFGRDGETLIILLAGGTKHRQQGDVAAAQARWIEYKQRKKAAR